MSDEQRGKRLRLERNELFAWARNFGGRNWFHREAENMNKRFAIIDKMYNYIQELEENDIPDTFWREKFRYFLTNEMNTLSVPDALALLDERMSEISVDYITTK